MPARRGHRPSRRREAAAAVTGTGFMSILLPVETGEGEVRRVIRESVIHALAAAGERPIRVDRPSVGGPLACHNMKRWFVEYETGPHWSVIDQPDQCG